MTITPKMPYTKKAITSTIFFFLLFFPLMNCLHADCGGKLDAGPAYLHVDVLESGHTVKSISMPAIKADMWTFIVGGVCAKPTFLYAGKGSNQIISAGCGFGHYTPIGSKCSITPSIGCNFTQFKTTFHNHPIMADVFLDLRERFRSISPYVALDASYCFKKGWRVVGSYQYVWSRTYTKIKNVLGKKRFNSSPKGSNYGLMLEADVNDFWSLNLGAAYNSSLTHEKHGLRGYGVRFGFAFWW
jgi:hypothetical protein